MHFLEITTFVVYFAILLGIGLITSRKQKTDTDFIIGNRSLNFWLTALSAHASDMSSWLFLAYPALIFVGGVFGAWAGIGLTLCMYLNWQFVAPRIRIVTEQTNSLTLSAYFENRFADRSGSIRLVSAISSLLFYTIYICSGLVGLGILVDSLFGLNYFIGITIGLIIVMIYVFAGGYKTVAWIDVFQGFFLLAVILFIPILLLIQIKGFGPVLSSIQSQGKSWELFPSFTFLGYYEIFNLLLGWGLGYFGQPHIITKFMGIRNVRDIFKSKILGMSWQVLALTGATVIGLIGIYHFPTGLADPEIVILEIVKDSLIPFFAALVLCAILAATTNVMAAQILVVASSLAEDFYKRLINPDAPSKTLLKISRISVVIVSLIAYVIAFFKISTIYKLVLYAWSGLGGTFGPLLLLSLYSKKVNRYGALTGIIVGAVIGAVWPYFNDHFNLHTQAMLPAFIFSGLTIYIISYLTKNKFALEEEF